MGNMHKYYFPRSDVYFRRYDRGKTNTDRQTDTLITILRSPIGGGVTTAPLLLVSAFNHGLWLTYVYFAYVIEAVRTVCGAWFM